MYNIKIAKELLLLAREITHQPIKFTNFVVKKDVILVTSPSTVYAHYERKNFSNDIIKEIKNKIANIRKLAKQKGIRLRNLNKKEKEIVSLLNEYDKEIKEYNKLFDKLYELWKKIEKKKDLFYSPTSDLEQRIPEYKKATELGWHIEEMFHGDKLLSKINSFNIRLDDILDKLNSNTKGITMLGF